MKPRVLFVSRRIELPLAPSLARKWDAIGEEIDFRVLAGGSGGNGVFRLARELPVLDGPAFFAALPLRVARELRAFRPHAVLAQGAHETAAALERAQARRDEHRRDRRSPRRLARSRRVSTARRLRGALNPVADRVALAALRKADGDQNRHRLHDGPRPGARPRAGGRVSRVHGLRLLPAGGAGDAARASGGALRRRARALQERRRARGGVAPRGTPGAGGAAATRRLRDDATAGRGARARASRADELDRAAHAERGVVGARRRRRSSSFRPAPKEWAA